MGNSLRDELLKAGLVASEPRRKTPRRKRGESGPARRRDAREKNASKNDSPKEDATHSRSVADKKHVLRENQRRTARFIRDASLAGPSVEESARKALRRRIEALVEQERLNDAAADVAYHFVKGKRIKRIYVTEAQRAQLGSGELVIAALEGNHHLMRAAAAEELKALAPQTTVCECTESDAGSSEEHPVPDDISW
ncbi:MAG: DUF2058 family protein [Gammaproteobacteria bacterium]|nr:DUF2058 family protein [Gammaproteobacteria bacterium]